MSDLVFDLDDVTLTMTVPNDQDATVLTRRLSPIADGHARLEGEDLGDPATVADDPMMGKPVDPARPIITTGGAYLTIMDDE